MVWGRNDIPRLSGRVHVVTGANSGIGYHAALELARHGATVVLACRSVERAEDAEGRIRQEAPDARIEILPLDLASLDSVQAFAEALRARHASIACLVNNAGVMAIPRAETADGFEMQLGVNHLGHFALTGLLLPSLLRADSPRVVTLTSVVHHLGVIRFSDLQGAERYGAWRAYFQSKLANMMFALELSRRSEAGGHRLRSIAAHPGYAATNLQHVAPRQSGSALMGGLMRVSNAVFAQSAATGALPTLYAAVASAAKNGMLVGPRVGFYGAPTEHGAARRAHDAETARRLWEVSCELTGVTPKL